MELDTLIDQLKHFEGFYPKQAIQDAIDHREVIIPELKNIIRETIDESTDVIDMEDNKLCTYAMYLLAQFREESAYPIVIDLLSLPNGRALEIVGDMFIEDIGRILASIAKGDATLIKTLIENKDVSELIRAAGIEAIMVMIHEKEITRDESIAYFKELFSHRLEKRMSVVWDCLVACSLDLHPADLFDEIDKAYEDELVDEDVVEHDKIYDMMDRDKDDVMDLFYKGTVYTLITDVIQELEEMAAIMEDETEVIFDE